MRDQTVSLREQFKGFTAVELPLPDVVEQFATGLSKFGLVVRSPLAGITGVVSFLAPIKSFTTRFAAIGNGAWCYLLSDKRGEDCHVDGYALSRLTGCRTMGLVVRDEQRELHVYEGGRKLREVQSLDDGEWYFRETGDIQEWEDADEYAKRNKRDRLSTLALETYFRRYTGEDIPHWAGLTDRPAEGLERSTHEVLVEIIHYNTDNDL